MKRLREPEVPIYKDENLSRAVRLLEGLHQQMGDMIEQGIRYCEALEPINRGEAIKVLTAADMENIDKAYAILDHFDFNLTDDPTKSSLRGWVERLPKHIIDRRPIIKRYFDKHSATL